MLDLKLYKLDRIQEACEIFVKRVWCTEGNKDLFNLVVAGRLNIAPCTIYKLDCLGLNHLEILEFNGIIGADIHKLPPATCDFLNVIETEKGCVFAYSQKAAFSEGKKKHPLYKLNGFCSDFKDGLPLRGVSLFNLDMYKLDYYSI